MMAPARASPAGTGSHSRSQSHSHSHSHSHAQANRLAKPSKSTTPLASPWSPHSVGQNQPPPKLSPGQPPDVLSSSPNYFGLIVEPVNNDPRDSSGIIKDNWSFTSSVKSFAAAIPKQVPLDANPEFEAFKRQVDLNKGKSFPLSTSHYASINNSTAPVRPRPPRWHTHASDTGSDASYERTFSLLKDRPSSRMDVDQDSLHDSAYVSSDSKRNSESSFFPPQITGPVRFESPRPMEYSQHRGSLTRAEDRDPRLSVMEHRADPLPPNANEPPRSSTLPPKLEPGQPSMISPEDLKKKLEGIAEDRLLLLDIRSSQNYSQSRIKGALNLCIPTTLLKRATFNIQKLQQTFQSGTASSKFSAWRNMDSIVVYDSHSSDKRDSVTAQNMIKKFTNEGYSGGTCILRGGFVLFSEMFPDLVDRSPITGSSTATRGCGSDSTLAPVIGGVNLPAVSNNGANPFFSNIRQNMDLADGVGQMDLKRPHNLESPLLPRWLRDAASQQNHGKNVSDKFLHIELDEQSRMKAAYAAFDGNNDSSKSEVQLCGVEKGGKNRYKDILPFEHARVKLQNKGEGSCDYINASHLKASGSNKRYIATQGPLPATFEDFWSTVWEQDVRVVVMLTAESEGGQLKCHPYWKGREYGSIKLKLLSEKKASLDIDKHRSESVATPSSSFGADAGRKRANTTTTLETATPTPQPPQSQSDIPFVIIRKFALSHAAYPFAPIREVTHLHFPSWPDFGTPAQASHLLALVELANVMQRAALPVETAAIVASQKATPKDLPFTWYDEPEAEARARPMLVHCSAGCGRTGTFCTVDTVIDMLKRERQTKISTSQQRDSDGDIAMGGNSEPVSPHSNREMSFKPTRRRESVDKRMTQGSPIDTTWLRDDRVDLIQKTVNEFRGQRLSMVQSLRQYVLCYEAVLEWLNRMNETTNNGRARSGSLQQVRR
ncbi:tyrosine phosphatase [Stachybotrys elegans]|uniref:protein-tyrosine-phosphatase n=1 Tax=Stachybotrys elegans TaxID=80388 RepID=A0A8K0SZ39_9HYPO|nr:tyrosine phosphatase [Stachybotrys elegans]